MELSRTGSAIRTVTEAADLRAAWPVVRQLRPALDEERFVSQALRQIENDGFCATVLYDDTGTPRAFAGWRVMEMLAVGRHIYVDDLVTGPAVRSAGYGGQLFDWLVERARAEGCRTLELDSGVQRFDAHRFYLVRRMSIVSHHFRLVL